MKKIFKEYRLEIIVIAIVLLVELSMIKGLGVRWRVIRAAYVTGEYIKNLLTSGASAIGTKVAHFDIYFFLNLLFLLAVFVSRVSKRVRLKEKNLATSFILITGFSIPLSSTPLRLTSASKFLDKILQAIEGHLQLLFTDRVGKTNVGIAASVLRIGHSGISQDPGFLDKTLRQFQTVHSEA